MKRAHKVLIAAASACLLSAVLAACAGSGAEDAALEASEAPAAEAPAAAEVDLITEASGPYAAGTHHVEVTVAGYPAFTIEVDADAAPVSASNFCNLAEQGYYDGLAFYRLVEGFCLQGGTLGNSASGHDAELTPIIGEFSANGIDNPLADQFEKGVVAMARTMDPDSATSTFFITLGSDEGVAQSLNGQYAAFGTIDEADMDVIDRIVADFAPNVADANGAIDGEENMPIIESIEVID